MGAEQDSTFAEVARELGHLSEAQVHECLQARAHLMAMGMRRSLLSIARDKGFLTAEQVGEIAWRSPARGLRMTISFDPAVFPYVCPFASYGALDGHYTAVPEPCTAMPLSVSEALAGGRCSVLEPGGEITTRVRIAVGDGERT